MNGKIGMVFGVFDGLHAGHQHFLKAAASKTEKLIVVVTRDDVSYNRKGFKPQRGELERVKALKSFDPSFTVVLGDLHDDDWHVVDEYDPERIFLGYDQGEIGEALRKMGIPYTFLDAYRATEFKSSIINAPREGS